MIYKIENLTLHKIIGCILGFAGIITINFSGLKGGAGFNLFDYGFVLISTVANGFSSVLIKRYSAYENPVMLSGWQFFFGGLVVIFDVTVHGGRICKINIGFVLILLCFAFVSAAVYSLWVILLKYNPVSKVAVFSFMNSICCVIISNIVLKEDSFLGIQSLVALILVCVGIKVKI